MPEMKLKQQNLLYNFKSTIKSLETKLNIIEKLDMHVTKSNLDILKSTQADKTYKEKKADIEKVKEISKRNMF
jgi:hypothetical protein